MVGSKKNRALLAYLALSPNRSATRERIAGLLWGEHGEEQARNSLRQSLAVLRKELGENGAGVLVTRDDTVALVQTGISIDVDEIAELAAADDAR
jgi:DNA-binding SARP family transcriptional activator